MLRAVAPVVLLVTFAACKEASRPLKDNAIAHR